jgi:hypothetical protein
MLDPLTAAVCTLPQIHDMVTEMLSRTGTVAAAVLEKKRLGD